MRGHPETTPVEDSGEFRPVNFARWISARWISGRGGVGLVADQLGCRPSHTSAATAPRDPATCHTLGRRTARWKSPPEAGTPQSASVGFHSTSEGLTKRTRVVHSQEPRNTRAIADRPTNRRSNVSPVASADAAAVGERERPEVVLGPGQDLAERRHLVELEDGIAVGLRPGQLRGKRSVRGHLLRHEDLPEPPPAVGQDGLVADEVGEIGRAHV